MAKPAEIEVPAQPARRPQPRIWGDLATLAVIFGLLLAVYLLPADTSLSQLRRAGLLTACVPQSYPPLVTGDQERPGYDVELLREIADRLGVRFNLFANSAIGQDFNPRSWRITRAQCQVLAGGVVLSREVRSFMDTLPTGLSTGWAVVSPEPVTSLAGVDIGFYTGLTGLDRIGLGRYLREIGGRARIMRSVTELEAALASGEVAVGVSEALAARQLAGRHDWHVAWMPENLGRYPLGIGLWRGDLTLLQAMTGILDDLEREGALEALAQKYDIAPLEGTIPGG